MEGKAFFAIILVILLVIGVNGALYLLMRRGKSNQTIQMWQRAAKSARNPWQEEKDQLEELSRLVKDMRQGETEESDEENG